LVTPSISGEGCGADVSDCAFAAAMDIPQTNKMPSEIKAVLKTVFTFRSVSSQSLF
jgi:hypothetical protein